MNRPSLRRRIVDRIWDEIALFKAGHQQFLVFPFSLGNTTLIWYNFLITQVPFLFAIFPTWTRWALFFAIFYPITARIFGTVWYHVKAGGMRRTQRLANLTNPWVLDFSRAFIAHIDGDDDAARKILRKWTEVGAN